MIRRGADDVPISALGASARSRRRPSRLWLMTICGVMLTTVAACGSESSGGSGAGSVGNARIVIPPATVVAEPFIAEAEGFFKKNGVNVKLLTAQGGGDAVKLWIGGQADFAATGTNLPMTLAEQNTQARDLIGLYTKNAFTIVAQPKLHIKEGDIAALKGLKVGVDSLGTPGDIMMRNILQSSGVDPKSETFVATNSGAPQVAAFEAGAVDVAITSDPATSILLAEGKATSVLDLRKGQGPASLRVPQASLAATSSYVSAHRDVAVAVVKSICEAMKFGRANPDKAVTDLRKVFPGQSQASLKLSVDATKDGWQANLAPQAVKNLNVIFNQTGSVKNQYTYNQVVDTSFQQYWSDC